MDKLRLNFTKFCLENNIEYDDYANSNSEFFDIPFTLIRCLCMKKNLNIVSKY